MLPDRTTTSHGSKVILWRVTKNPDFTGMIATLTTIRSSDPWHLVETAKAFASGDNPSTTGTEITKSEIEKGNFEGLGHVHFTFIIEGLSVLALIDFFLLAAKNDVALTIQMPSAQHIKARKPDWNMEFRSATKDSVKNKDDMSMVKFLQSFYNHIRDKRINDEMAVKMLHLATKTNMIITLSARVIKEALIEKPVAFKNKEACGVVSSIIWLSRRQAEVLLR